jgi:acetylornithine/succinyldiaminopimelate/putrescine aminotransferase
LEFSKEQYASEVFSTAQDNGLLLNLKHGTIIRIFPALTITDKEIIKGMNTIRKAIDAIRKVIN